MFSWLLYLIETINHTCVFVEDVYAIVCSCVECVYASMCLCVECVRECMLSVCVCKYVCVECVCSYILLATNQLVQLNIFSCLV